MSRNSAARLISAVDLFCGAGGLSYGLKRAGISVVAGVDLDPACRYPFKANLEAPYLELDVRDLKAAQLDPYWVEGSVRLLAGCAPCQPFSPYRQGRDTSDEADWSLLGEFGRIAEEAVPDLITIENVPRMSSAKIFKDFVKGLKGLGYSVDWRSCRAADYGLPQTRRRLVLLASRLDSISIPAGRLTPPKYRTVRETIGKLPDLKAGSSDGKDRLHKSRGLSELNLERIQASKPGGTWRDWPDRLRAPCHKKKSGSTFKNVYARMEWDAPAPTITTLAYNFGTGRFGHPSQDRAISLREAAMLQGFPRKYKFVAPKEDVTLTKVGRLIGNAVPPPLAEAIGREAMRHVRKHDADSAAA
jgi:DNA (cytosine-5)-methyltransferase 1